MKVMDTCDQRGFLRTVTFPDGTIHRHAIKAGAYPAETMKQLADGWLDALIAKRKK